MKTIDITDLEQELTNIGFIELYDRFISRLQTKEEKSWLVMASSKEDYISEQSLKIRTYDSKSVIVDLVVNLK